MKTPLQARRMRIYLDESDRWQGRPLYQAVLEAAHEEHLAGATVMQGLSGFGYKSRSDAQRRPRAGSGAAPIVIEIVDSAENIERFLPRLDELMNEGFVTFDDVQAVSYRAP